MDTSRLHLVLLSLLLVLMGFNGYVMKRQEDSVRRVETSLTEMRQTMAEMRNKLPQGPPPTGATGSGQTSQFPPGLGPQGNPGTPGAAGSPGAPGAEKGQHKGQGKGKGGGKGSEQSPSAPEQSPQVPGGVSPAGPQSPPLANPGHGDVAAPSAMAVVLARLIVLEYRADMALTDAQTTDIKQVLQKFKNHGVDMAAVEKAVAEKLTAKQRSYLKDEEGQVKTKAQELSSISGKDDLAYADLALDFLDKPIRPGAPASP